MVKIRTEMHTGNGVSNNWERNGSFVSTAWASEEVILSGLSTKEELK